jgi:anti-anti-sigma factor
MSDSIQLSQTGTADVLNLTGRICAQGDGGLGTALEDLERKPRMVKAIDLTGIEFIDSYALGQILYFCSKNRDKGMRTVLVNASGDEENYIHKLIEVAELGQVVDVVTDVNAVTPDDQESGN